MNKLKYKKGVAVMLILFGLTDIAGAQTLDKSPSKEWYYGYASHEIWASQYFYQHLVTAGDTTIMGKDCMIIRQADDYGNGFDASSFGYVNMGKNTFFLHREPDRLLWFNEEMGGFTTLHDYSAQAGDSWTIQVDSCSFDVVVDSTDVAFFGGKSHRVLYVHDSVYETSYFPFYEGCIIEDVGHTKHFFPIEIYWLCHNSFLCGTPEPLGIRCVIEDGEILYHQGEIACDSAYSVTHLPNTWPKPGAEWTYCLYADGNAYAKEVWRVTGDSLIGNHIYNVIQPVDTLGRPIPNSGKMLLTRCESNKVYRYVNNKEYLFFPLDLNEGDVFTTFRSAGWGANGVLNYGNDSTCSSLKPLLVTEKKEVELGGLTLNEYTLKDTLFTSLYGYEDLGYWKMVDRIGPIDTYPLIDINEIGYYDNLCLYWFVCAPYVYLSAYRDDTFEYVWFMCNPTSVAENSLDEEIEVYPNPTNGQVTITGKDMKTAEVINTLGQRVATVKGEGEHLTVDISNLPAGVYFVNITDSEGRKCVRKVVKE